MPTTNKSLVQQVYNTSTGNLPADQVVDPAYISTPYPNWSIPINYDLGAMDLALGGLVTISVTGLLVDQTMVLSQYQPMSIVFSGTLSANIKYSLPSSVGGTWSVYNNTTGAFTLSMGSPTGATTVVIPAGGPYIVTCNSSTGIKLLNGYNAANSITTAMIQNDAVTYAKIQNVSATSLILARKSAGAGDVEEATLSEVLDFIGSAAQGDILYRGASAWARLPAGTANQVLRTAGAGANPSWSGVQTLGTSQSLTGSTITFSGIPSGVRQIEVAISGMSLSSTTGFRLRLGASGVLATSGYNSVTKCIFNDSGSGGNILSEYSNTSFICLLWNSVGPNPQPNPYYGSGTFTLTNVTGFTWAVTHTLGVYLADGSSVMISTGGGNVVLGGTLDRVALLPVSGTFSTGTANILYTVT